MQSIQPEYTFDIRYVTNANGIREFVQIPVVQWEVIRARLLHNAKEYVPTADDPEVIDREGILVIRAEPLEDLAEFVNNERERRISACFERSME
jgi:hypothetical protein